MFFIPSEKLPVKKNAAALIKAGIVALGAAALLLLQHESLFAAFGGGEEKEELPADALRVLLRTVAGKTDFYLASMTGSYMGWHQLVLPAFVWVPMLALLFLSLLPTADEPRGSRRVRKRAGGRREPVF